MLKNLSITPSKKTARQESLLSHRLLFDNGEEIDLAKSNFISAAKPNVKPLPNHNSNNTNRQFQAQNERHAQVMTRNSVHSKTLMSQSSNRTPMLEARNKISMIDQADEDRMQRMANLLKKNGSNNNAPESRFRVRHASAHVTDSQLENKIDNPKQMQLSKFSSLRARRKSEFMEIGQFKNPNQLLKQQNSSASLANVVQHNARGTRSLTRVQLNENPSVQSIMFPPLNSNSNNITNIATVTAMKRVAPQKPMDQLISAFAGMEDLEDGQLSYLDKRSTAQPNSNLKLLQAADQSSRMSHNQMDQQSMTQYQMEMVDDKREEIQNIIKKRQRKAALVSINKQSDAIGQPTMTGFIGRSDKFKDSLLLPDIGSNPLQQQHNYNDRPSIRVENTEDNEEYNGGQITVRRMPNSSYQVLGDSSQIDEEELKIQKLQSDVEAQYKKQDMEKQQLQEQKQKQLQGHPELETMKRANRKATGKDQGQEQKYDSDEDKHEQRVQNMQQKLIKIHSFNKNRESVNSLRHSNTVIIPQDTSNNAVVAAKQSPKNTSKKSSKNLATQLVEIGNSLIESQHNAQKQSQPPPLTGFQQQTEDIQSALLPNSSSPVSPSQMRSPRSPRSPGLALNLSMNSVPEESRGSTAEETALSQTYNLMAEIVDPQSAMRIQRKVTKKKDESLKQKLLFAAKQQTEASAIDETSDDGSADSSLKFEKKKRDEFNSQLDLYSEIDSSYFKTPARGRRGTILRQGTMKVPVTMKAIPAEDSADERDSMKSSQQYGSEGEQGEDEQEESEELVGHESNMDERATMKKALLQKKFARNEQEELMGPRLVKKIDDFVFQIAVEAGLDHVDIDQDQKDQFLKDNAQQEEMLQTGNTSLFQIEKTKNDDQGVYQRVMDKYVTELRGQQAFFQLCKMAKDSKFTDPDLNNPLVQYYNECVKANSVAKPLLSKIVNKTLILRDLKLNKGDSMGLRDNLMHHQNLVSKLYLDSNGMDGFQTAAICEGLTFQKDLYVLIIQGNEVNEKTAEQIIPMLKRRIPENLQELHFLHAKCVWRATDDLLQGMRQRNYLRKLSLVEAGLNDFSMVHLCEVVRTQKTLISLDISWNMLMPYQMRPLVEILSKNRRLTNLSLAWNNIMEVGKEDDPEFEETVAEINWLLGKIIKHSKTMIHINLTGTGLSAGVIYEIGTCLRRARSVLVIHVSGNPGLSRENMEYLPDRVKCRPREDIERYTRITGVVKGVLRATGAVGNIMDGIKVRVERDSVFHQVHKKDPIQFSANDQLIFQRMLGHKEEQPGSGQWYESSKNAVACKTHYKNECWICEGHVYSILFWSKAMCYKLNPVLSKDKTEEVRFEIDRDFGPEEANDLVYHNTNVKYREQENQVPFVCGSFTGWRYRKMISLEAFNRSFETEAVDPFDIACSQGKIRKRVMNKEQCNEYERRYVEIAELEEKLRYTYAWRHFLAKNLRYKRPYAMNSQVYCERPSPDGTLPEDDEMGEIFSDSSEEPESNQEEEKKTVPEEKKIKMSSLTLEQQEQMKLDAIERAKFPIPPLPDVNKFDKVFILPMFCKPGKHQYMIKYKDTSEPRQADLLKKIHKQEKRYRRAKNDLPVSKPYDKIKYREAKKQLSSQCFFYQCEVPRRIEEIPPYVKTMTSKVVVRAFDKEVSLFGKWRQDTPASLNTACTEDLKVWKGYRFIKLEDDRADTEAVLRKYFAPLKDCFLHLAATSAWPNIGQLDFADFAAKAKFLDNFVNLSAIDRTFIAANLKVSDSVTAPSNGLKRYEFLEILARLANIKYLESKRVKTFAEATEKLLVECVLPGFTPEPWQEFRIKELWTIDVNDLLEANLDNLKKIYAHYLTPTKKLIELEDCIAMCTRDCNLNISEKDIQFCFGYSQMTVQNEEKQWKTYQSLQIVEFLEFLGRMAHTKFKNASQEMASQPLAQKLEFLLDDLMQGFGMTRHDVNIEVEENSESDEDY